MTRSPLLRIVLPLLLLLGSSVFASTLLRMRSGALQEDHTVHVPVRLLFAAGTDAGNDRAVGPQGNFHYINGSGILYSVAPSGVIKWHLDVGRYAQGLLCSADGTLYVVSTGGILRAIAPDGKQKWQRALYADKRVAGTVTDDHGLPAASLNGDVYIVANKRLRGFSTNGTPKCNVDLRQPISDKHSDGSPKLVVEQPTNHCSGWRVQVGADGGVYVTDSGGTPDAPSLLHALTANGKQRWQLELPGNETLTVDPRHDRLYFRSGKHALRARDAQRKLLWETEVNIRAMQFDPDGNVYCATHEGQLQAFDLAGRLLWTVWEDADMLAAADNGPLYCAKVKSGVINALDRTTGKQIWHTAPVQHEHEGFTLLHFVFATADGGLYFETGDSEVFAAGP